MSEREMVTQTPADQPFGGVDLRHLAYNLSLTIAQRFERHYAARMFVQTLKKAAREKYGSADLKFPVRDEETERGDRD